jgi:hypothetical protein
MEGFSNVFLKIEEAKHEPRLLDIPQAKYHPGALLNSPLCFLYGD